MNKLLFSFIILSFTSLICDVNAFKCRKIPDFHIETKVKTQLQNVSLPTEWSWNNISGRNFLTVVRQQHIPQYCGSCWAQAASSALSDRIKIRRNASWPDYQIAPQVIISCDDVCQGCHGGLSILAYKYIMENNITDETCSPYQAAGHDNGIPCSSEIKCLTCWGFDKPCEVPQTYPLYTVEEYGWVNHTENMMQEIYQRGPISCGIVADPIRNYTGGVFSDPNNYTVLDIDHDVSVVGYGEENGIPYWRIRNSWGTHYGEQGFFRVYRGNNTLGIESNCSWAVPKDTWTNPQEWLNHTTAEDRIKAKNSDYVKKIEKVRLEKKFLAQQFDKKNACYKKNPKYANKSYTISPRPHEYLDASQIPSQHDWRNVNGINYLSWNKNQHIPQYCGSCWAQGSTSSLADRFQIMNYNSKYGLEAGPVALSVQAILNCEAGGSCHGGDPIGVYQFGQENGIPHESCQNYEAADPDSADCSAIQQCKDCSQPIPDKIDKKFQQYCTAVEYRHHYVEEYGSVYGADQMKAEILARGPISCGVDAEPLITYTGGVFKSSDFSGINHIISVIGWGTDDDGQQYWIGRNSWGNYWGEQGFFRITMDSDYNLGIDTDCSWGTPSYTKPNVQKKE